MPKVMEGEMMEDMGLERTSPVRTSPCSPGSSLQGLGVTTGNSCHWSILSILIGQLNTAPPPLATGVVVGVGSWWTVRDKISYKNQATTSRSCDRFAFNTKREF